MSPNNELNIDQYKKYLSGAMSEDERSTFERKLELDPFAKEALEGFTQMEQPNEMVVSINAIEEKIRSRTGIQKNKTPVFPLFKIASIAAVLVAVIGGGFLVSKMLSSENKLAENQTNSDDDEVVSNTKKDQKETIKEGYFGYTDSVTLNFSENGSIAEFIDTENASLEQSILEETPVNQEVLEEEPSFSLNNNAPVAPEIVVDQDEFEDGTIAVVADEEKVAGSLDKEERYKKEESLNSVSVTSSETDEYRNETETVALGDLAVEKESNSELTSFESGLKSYQRSYYNDAISSFNNSISESKKVAESNYYLGLSYMSVNKASKAMKAFDNVIDSPSSLKNNAKWYKASILISKGKNAEAKTLLEDLINSNSSFKQSAQEKLKEL